MDRKTRRGRVDIRAKIDLHDMRLDQAELALHGALVRAAAAQIPVLLVITGKGVRLEGKIRQAFPGWISSPAMNEYVASYAQAHIRHGGTGAWYIFLRTPKPRAE
jgi:DNA-nicking Smr family endonuclease